MSLPEILPILTTDRVMWEVRPVTKDDREVYDWIAVRKMGDRLTAICSPVEHLHIRDVNRLTDEVEQIDRLLDLAKIEVWFKGAKLGGDEKIPAIHRAGLFIKIYRMSSVGSDPFADLPVGSSP